MIIDLPGQRNSFIICCTKAWRKNSAAELPELHEKMVGLYARIMEMNPDHSPVEVPLERMFYLEWSWLGNIFFRQDQMERKYLNGAIWGSKPWRDWNYLYLQGCWMLISIYRISHGWVANHIGSCICTGRTFEFGYRFGYRYRLAIRRSMDVGKWNFKKDRNEELSPDQHKVLHLTHSLPIINHLGPWIRAEAKSILP